MILLACIFILLYGLVQYAKGRKGRGAFVFFFLLTGGFHFLSLDWCPVKYTDFAVVYLVAVALFNILKGNRKFFKPQIKIYKVATIIGLYFSLVFIRTIILKEEIFSFALASYRTYLLIFSFWLVQELKEWEIKRLLKLIASITIVSTVLFDLQPLLLIKILQHANVQENVPANGIVRYRNIPYLAYFFMLLTTIRMDFSKWKSVALVLVFLIAIVLTQHRAVMIAYVFCVGLHLLMTKKRGRFLQYGLIVLVFSLFAGEAILSRFEDDKSNQSTIEDIEAVINLDYESAVNNEFENENGTFSFRVLLLTERLNYMINHPRNAVFGLGTRHEDSPKTQRQFDFFLGTDNHRGGIGQLSSADLAWVTPLMRFGFLGIALLLYLSWVISTFFYKNRTISDMTMTAFLFYIFLLLTSFKNDHLYGNMQLFFIYLLIEYIRYSNVKLRVKTE